jgi:predicted exporter
MTGGERGAVLLWLAALATAIWLFAFHTRITTDLTGFLPRSAGLAEQLLVQQMREGVASRLILMGIEGAAEGDLARLSKGLATRLEADRHFSFVGNGHEVFSPAERELLMRNRYLLSPDVTADHFTAPALRTVLKRRLAELASPLGLVTGELLRRDPTGELLRLLRGWGNQQGPAVRDGVWFSPDGRCALLMAQTVAPGFDAAAQQQATAAVHKAFASLYPGSARLMLSGPGIFAAQSKRIIERDSWRLSALATLLVVVILFFVYRSALVVLLGMLPVVTGLVIGVALVGLGFGSIHGITLGFGATLIGEAVDYPSYLFTHVASGEPVRTALQRILPTFRLAVLTTVFGGLAMLLSSFQGLEQLGLLSIVGVLTAGAVTRWVLPALAPRRFGLRKAQGLPDAVSRAVRRSRKLSWLVWPLLTAAIAVLAVEHGRVWDNDLANMSPVPELAKALDQRLRSELGAPDVRDLVVVTAPGREEALRRSEEVAKRLLQLLERGTIGGFDMAANYLPSERTQAARRAALPDRATLQAALAEATQGLHFKAGVFAPFVNEVERVRRHPLLTAADFRGTALGLKVDSLLVQSHGRWVAFMPLSGVADKRTLAKAVAGEPDLLLLDLKTESNRMVNGYRNQSLRLTGLGIVAIALVLLFGLEERRQLLRILIPVLVAVVVTVATLLLLGERLSLFHIVSLLLVIGIGLNYALFFNRRPRDRPEQRRTELALAVCSLSTLSAFGALALSQTPVLHAIGLTVSLGAVLSLLISMVLARPQVECEDVRLLEEAG